jgi:hypothetical protein
MSKRIAENLTTASTDEWAAIILRLLRENVEGKGPTGPHPGHLPMIEKEMLDKWADEKGETSPIEWLDRPKEFRERFEAAVEVLFSEKRIRKDMTQRGSDEFVEPVD